MFEIPRLLLTLYQRDPNDYALLFHDILCFVLGPNHGLVAVVKFHTLLTLAQH
jgi:hypothetical protein